MRKSLLSTWVALTLCAVADEPAYADRIAVLNRALQDGGVTGLLAVVSDHRWDAPWIPSKWHVENRIKDGERVKVADAGRDFGFRLAKHLESVAEQFQSLPPGEELCSLSLRMCDLSDWCASTDGRENLFLARRCLDLAAVGLGRVTASLDFPLEKCQILAARMSPQPDWMSEAKRARGVPARKTKPRKPPDAAPAAMRSSFCRPSSCWVSVRGG